MDTTALEAFARGLGALPSAVEDVVRRAVHHFGDTEPDHETLTTWGTALKTQCRLSNRNGTILVAKKSRCSMAATAVGPSVPVPPPS